jgi:putative peptidoglycan lipid II flippase
VSDQATAPPSNAPAPPPSAGRRTEEGGLLRAAGLVGVLSILGSLLGFIRDLTIAGLFGASAETDAFVVAWTIPETATPLLMEGAMAALLIPLFSHELVRRGNFRQALGGILLPLLGVLLTLTTLTALAAPFLVSVLAPGLAEPETAERSVRVASLTILLLGLAGYLSAALRARNIFGWPGSIFMAYNVGILASILLFYRSLGIFSAAIGLAVGASFMVLIQLPVFLRSVGVPRPRIRLPADLLERLTVFIPLATYTITRHAQVFVERFAGSLLPVGSITQLNYAAKIGQIPMLLALTVAAVTMPVLSRTAAGGSPDQLRPLVERNYRWVIFLVVPATAFFGVFAGESVGVLFERGAFTSADTEATAGVLRVYCLGLLGQVLVGVSVQALVAVPGRTWRPARAALFGLLATAGVAAVGAPLFGVQGIALANALGISLMALLLMLSLPSRGIVFDLRAVGAHLARCAVAAASAAAVGLGVERVVKRTEFLGNLENTAVLVVAGLSLLLAYAALTYLLGIAESNDAVRFLQSWRATRRERRGGVAPGLSIKRRRTRSVTEDGERRGPSTTEGGQRTRSWVLMYHAVEPYEHDPWQLCVSPDRFRRQMQWLADRGTRAVSMRELRRAQATGDASAMVGLTFDDGYAGFPDHVSPILAEFGFSATIFAIAGRLGGSNEWDEGPSRALLTAEQLRELAAGGIEIGSHGMTHARLAGLPHGRLVAEVNDSRSILEELTGDPIEGFCYPYGSFDDASREAVRAAGYEYACAVSPVEYDDRYLISRAFVGEKDGPLRLSAKLTAHRLAQQRR